MTTLILIWRLAVGVHHAYGVPGPVALEHAVGAVLAQTPQLPAELLLAVTRIESNFVPTAVSRVRGKRFCGPIQAMTRSRARCRELADVLTGYRVGVDEIHQHWLSRTRNVGRALAGHGCGNAGLVTGCKRYWARVQYRRRQLRRATSSISSMDVDAIYSSKPGALS